MHDMSTSPSTVVSRVIAAPREAVYRALLDKDAVAAWLPPTPMTGVIHAFDVREGGTFRISLVYPEDDGSSRGKSSERTDTVRGRFVTLIPNERVVWATEFESADPSFAGEMILTWALVAVHGGTEIGVLCENIPRGIRPEDNEAGCRSTLENLAAFLER
jgi:uncharacterized protein YndB with AHSA1/START domain